MKLCVGATSIRVVEEAARIQVPQIVASRRQVAPGGGYTGLDPYELVERVKDISNGKTDVVRDHGGPFQGGFTDDGTRAFDIDVDAGFDGIHIDVCQVDRDRHVQTLQALVGRYADADVDIEIGGERDEQEWLDVLLDATLSTGVTPTYAVMDVGGHAHADRQCGTPRPVEWVEMWSKKYHSFGVGTKAHNMDWMGRRSRYEYVLDMYNVAPEFAAVEIDAMLQAMTLEDGERLLAYASSQNRGARWFDEGEGTSFERARCDARYVLNDEFVHEILDGYGPIFDNFVRGRIRDALIKG